MTKSKPYYVFINKPVGMTSTDVVRYLKINLPRPVEKIGHIGTLDPFAEGLLIIGVNGAQKTNDFIHENGAKTYLAHGVFGISTSTGDHTGEVIGTNDLDKDFDQIKEYSTEELSKIFSEKFLGEYFQKPHKVSAVKINGKRLYDYERAGIEVEIKPIRREVFSLEILEFNFPNIIFRAKVSSGTYIRVLFEEMAQMFQLFGHLTRLVRESVGEIDLSRAISKEHWPIKGDSFDRSKFILLPDVIIYPKVIFSDHHVKLYSQGVRLRIDQIFSSEDVKNVKEGQRFWIYDQNEDLVGLFEVTQNIIKHLYNFAK